MGIGKVVVGWTTLHLARFLATKVATPLILTGTLALAGAGAMGTPIAIHQSPTYPNSSCHPSWYGDGSVACRIPDSQVGAYPNAYCYPSFYHPHINICHFWRNASQ